MRQDIKRKFPVDAIVFDCDSTLSQIEGIDVLAEQNGVGAEVSRLTKEAMDKTGITPELYQKRMSLVKPTRTQVVDLGREYFEKRSPDAEEVISILMKMGKAVFILSAGLNPAVKIFGNLLGISEKNVFAVKALFDDQGNYLDYDSESPTAKQNGKFQVIETIKKKYPLIIHVGDGMNDYQIKDHVDQFIGYGGAVYRKNMAELSPYYITSASLLPILPLCLTEEEMNGLSILDQEKYQRGWNSIVKGEVQVLGGQG